MRYINKHCSVYNDTSEFLTCGGSFTSHTHCIQGPRNMILKQITESKCCRNADIILHLYVPFIHCLHISKFRYETYEYKFEFAVTENFCYSNLCPYSVGEKHLRRWFWRLVQELRNAERYSGHACACVFRKAWSATSIGPRETSGYL